MKTFFLIFGILAAYNFVGAIIVTIAWPPLKRNGAESPIPYFFFWPLCIIYFLLMRIVYFGIWVAQKLFPKE